MNKKIDKSKIILICVIVFLCAVFDAGFAWGLSSVLAMEGAYPPSENEASVIDIPTGISSAVRTLKEAVENAESNSPALKNTHTFTVQENSLNTDGTDTLTKTVGHILPGFDNVLDNIAETNIDFGCRISAILVNPKIRETDVAEFYDGNITYVCASCSAESAYYCRTCPNCGNGEWETETDSYIYYVCPSCGEERDTPADSCEKCGSTQSYNEKYRDEYNITLEINNRDFSLLTRLFADDTSEKISDAVNSVCSDNNFTLKDTDTNCVKAYVKYGINRLTGEMTYMKFVRQSDVTLVLSFENGLESLGEKTVSFVIVEENNFEFTWPSLKLNEVTATVEPKGNGNLLATLTCGDAAKTDVTWTSSDENILTVDSEGYYKAGKTEGSAVITASFEFNEKTYTDSCVVNVRYSVESSRMNRRKLTLIVGENEKLSVRISPSNATVKTVKWYTTDENIVTVDSDGNIKAVAKGTATVYTLTDDGYYKSSCEVSVE